SAPGWRHKFFCLNKIKPRLDCPKSGADVRSQYGTNERKSLRSVAHKCTGSDTMRRNSTNMIKKLVGYFGLVMVGAAILVSTASAQPFTYTNNDLMLGFRKTGAFAGTFEVVVNIGKATNYVKAPAGTSFAVPNFSLSQLTP